MKKQTLIILGLFVATMSSCVYSLFPIYTEETLVFKKELLGKWAMDDKGSYMLFEAMSNDAEPEVKKEIDYKYSIVVNEGVTLSSDEPIFIELNGKKVYDEDSIRMTLKERMTQFKKSNSRAKENNDEENGVTVGGSNTKTTFSDTESSNADIKSIDIMEAIKENIKEDKLKPQDISYEGSVTVFEDKSYKLTVFSAEEEGPDENAKKEAYIAHLVDIGGDLFMDLYPEKEFNSANISDNFFPVHTFFKVKVTEDEFSMTHFDLDKLNKLFESNLIRLRHENVEGTILITAQPKELQKFLDKYSDDENVFDFTETYKRAL